MSVLSVIHWMITSESVVTAVMLLTFVFGILFKLIGGGSRGY